MAYHAITNDRQDVYISLNWLSVDSIIYSRIYLIFTWLIQAKAASPRLPHPKLYQQTQP